MSKVLFDVIIPCNTKDEYTRVTTEASLKSLRFAKNENVCFNVVVVEQNQSAEKFELADETIYYDFPFNYNKVLNLGIKKTTAKYVLLANNDLVYCDFFADNLLKAFKAGYKSLSPTSPSQSVYSNKMVIEGYGINSVLNGWCICAERKTIEKIGYLDESVVFWYSDNIYAYQLKYNCIKHARVTNSYVFHLGSSTLKKSESNTKKDYTNGQKKIFEDKLSHISLKHF